MNDTSSTSFYSDKRKDCHRLIYKYFPPDYTAQKKNDICRPQGQLSTQNSSADM